MTIKTFRDMIKVYTNVAGIFKGLVKTKILISVGGLGNQLFLFNFAHKLLESSSSRVLIITNWHDNQHDRPLELDKIISNCSHKITLISNKSFYKSLNVFFRIDFKLGISRLTSIIYNEMHTNSTLNYRNNVVLNGYFQSNKFFPKNDHVINEIKLTLNQIRNNFPSQIVNSKSFQGIHIRRGDYKAHQLTFGQLDFGFFLSQLRRDLPCVIAIEGDGAKFQDLIPKEISSLLLPNNYDAWQLLYVLSKSDYFVGSNSTLSYWVARIVVSDKNEAKLPSPWFRNHPKYLPELDFPEIKLIDAIWVLD